MALRLASLLATVLMVSLSAASSVAAQNRLPVLATFSILGDIVQNVGSNRVDLRVLVGPDQDSHEYEPVPADALELRRVAIVFENGLGFESWLDRLYTASGSTAWRVAATAGILPLAWTESDMVVTDPHVWGDVQNVIHMTSVVADALAQADPANAATYAANAAAYTSQLNDLDTWIISELSALPSERRKLVTNHESLGYFARRYGFEVIGTLTDSFSTDAEPSARRVADLIEVVRSSGVRAIFVENIANSALLDRVASAAGVKVAPSLFTDALGGPDTPGNSYINLMRWNTMTIVAALTS